MHNSSELMSMSDCFILMSVTSASFKFSSFIVGSVDCIVLKFLDIFGILFHSCVVVRCSQIDYWCYALRSLTKSQFLSNKKIFRFRTTNLFFCFVLLKTFSSIQKFESNFLCFSFLFLVLWIFFPKFLVFS